MREIPVHPLLIPGNTPPLVYGLAVKYPGGLEVYSFLTSGIPPKIYKLITEEDVVCYFPRDMQLMGRQYFGMESLRTWHVASNDPDLQTLQRVEATDWRYPNDEAMDLIDQLLGDMEGAWDWTEETWRERKEDVSMVEEVPNDPEFLADMRKRKRDSDITLTHRAPHVANQNLITYLTECTFSPSRAYYDLELQSRTSHMGEVAKDTIERQAKVHDRMLKSGSTQATCAGDIKINDYVRYEIQRKRHRDPTPAEALRGIVHNSTLEPDGSQTWTSKSYRVIDIAPATETQGAQFKLRGTKRAWFYRGEICPVNNIVEGAIVRIRLAANPFYRKQIEQIIKSGERLFKYNHMFSRSLFEVESKETVDGIDRYFLNVVWEGGRVFKTAVWETVEEENRWSKQHEGFNGYLVHDLLRVDQQTALLLDQENGVEKYTDYIKAVAFRIAPRKNQYDKAGNYHAVTTTVATPSLVIGDEKWVELTTEIVKWLEMQGVLEMPKGDRSFEVFTEQKGALWLDLRRTLMTGSCLETWAMKGQQGKESVKITEIIQDFREHFALKPDFLLKKNEFGERMKQKNCHWGTIHEASALQAYQTYMSVKSPGLDVRAGTTIPGMLIDRAYQIAASPDGWVFDSASPEATHVGIVEFKCPVGDLFARYKYLDPRNPHDMAAIMEDIKITPPDFYKEMYNLKKKNRGYYYQCMANLFLTSAEWIDFVAWVPPGAHTFPGHPKGQPNIKVHRFYRSEMESDWRALQSTLSTRHNLYKDVFTQNMEAFLLKYKDTRVS
jgi:hypothetical protein